MTNKIVILQNSVELYEHYINDQKWERTLSFPRGGLTYLISNGTIKFYAFEDYLYRNCLISMQLPIHIINNDESIDGEYTDIDEITDILDEMFPVNDINIELKEYLKIRDAELLYQPIGDYVTPSELDEVLEDYYTKDETSGATEIQNALDGKADADSVYTKQESDDRFQPIGDYVSGDTFSAYTADTATVLSGKADADSVYTKLEIDGMMDDKADADSVYTKQESDDRFQPVGDYASADTFSAYTAQTDAAIQELEENKLDASAYTPCDLSNYYTKDETSGKVQIAEALALKLDVSDYTPFDPSEYYTKTEVDNKIASGGTFDPTKYYTKDVSDSRFALKTEIPSLSGYATQSWVLNKNYVTNSTLQQYITNLQEQINTLTEAVSHCCGETGETIYRWVTMTGSGDFICSGTTKYEKQVYQQSTDGGATWTNVQPVQYRKGAVLQYNSPDCGYAPEPQYRWVNAPTSDYMCSGTTKYYKQYKEVSTDSGQSWSRVVPEETRMGGVISYDSTDCGYVSPIYRWSAANPITDYICDTDSHVKYYKEYYQVSYDNGVTWENVQPVQTRANGIVNIHSTDCGEPHVADMLMTYKVTSGQSAHLLQGNVSLGSLQAQLDRNEWTELRVTGSGGGNPIYATFNYTDTDAKGKIEWTSDGIHATSFSGTDLHSAIVYDGIVYTQGDVWANCPYLESLELPSTFARCSWTFVHDCPNLKTVICNAINPPSMFGKPFENCPKLEAIYVPDNSVEQYKQDHLGMQTWSAYKDIIRPLSSLNS